MVATCNFTNKENRYPRRDKKNSSLNDSDYANFYLEYDVKKTTIIELCAWHAAVKEHWTNEERNSHNKLQGASNEIVQFLAHLTNNPVDFLDLCQKKEEKSKWIVDSYDISCLFAGTISWEEIRSLSFDDPKLSFIIDFSKHQKKLQQLLPEPVFKKIINIPIYYLEEPPLEFSNLFRKFYRDRERWELDDFGYVNKIDQNNNNSNINQFFYRFSVWDEKLENKTNISEGTWERIVLDPILKIMTRKINHKCFWQWAEAVSLASDFQKELYARKPDFCLPMDVAGTTQEMMYHETSGSPLVKDLDKWIEDRHKLFRFGRDSKNMICEQLINYNIKYLDDHEALWKKLCDTEIFLFQSYDEVGMYVESSKQCPINPITPPPIQVEDYHSLATP
ncbi:8324_t:CDS:2 [Entrophospora sp. SA101]|nr:8324_t:CDS:2 [Entrophospora sp. SA101]